MFNNLIVFHQKMLSSLVNPLRINNILMLEMIFLSNFMFNKNYSCFILNKQIVNLQYPVKSLHTTPPKKFRERNRMIISSYNPYKFRQHVLKYAIRSAYVGHCEHYQFYLTYKDAQARDS